MLCPECGCDSEGMGKFCGQCGETLHHTTEAEDTKTEPPQEPIQATEPPQEPIQATEPPQEPIQGNKPPQEPSFHIEPMLDISSAQLEPEVYRAGELLEEGPPAKPLPRKKRKNLLQPLVNGLMFLFIVGACTICTMYYLMPHLNQEIVQSFVPFHQGLSQEVTTAPNLIP